MCSQPWLRSILVIVLVFSEQTDSFVITLSILLSSQLLRLYLTSSVCVFVFASHKMSLSPLYRCRFGLCIIWGHGV